MPLHTIGLIPQPNPHRIGGCPDCGSYRSDGRWPYLHHPGCPHERDPQAARMIAELRSGDHGGPTIYCTAHDHLIPLPGYEGPHAHTVRPADPVHGPY